MVNPIMGKQRKMQEHEQQQHQVDHNCQKEEEEDGNGVGTIGFGEDGETKSPDVEETKPNRD